MKYAHYACVADVAIQDLASAVTHSREGSARSYLSRGYLTYTTGLRALIGHSW